MEHIKVPQVDYRNLKIRHIQPPKRFDRLSKFKDKMSPATEYSNWVKEVVLSSTKEGDRALVVIHKKLMIEFEIIEYKP